MYVCVFVCVCVCVCVCVYVCNIFLFILSQKFGGFLTTWSPFGKMLRHFSVKGKQWRYVPPWARNDHSTNNKSENPTLRNGNYSILVPFLVELAFLSRKKTNKNPTCWNAIQILCCLLVRKARIFSRKKILKTLPSETPFHIVPSPCWRSSHFFSQKKYWKAVSSETAILRFMKYRITSQKPFKTPSCGVICLATTPPGVFLLLDSIDMFEIIISPCHIFDVRKASLLFNKKHNLHENGFHPLVTQSKFASIFGHENDFY